jgi:hypothetical protein
MISFKQVYLILQRPTSPVAQPCITNHARTSFDRSHTPLLAQDFEGSEPHSTPSPRPPQAHHHQHHQPPHQSSHQRSSQSSQQPSFARAPSLAWTDSMGRSGLEEIPEEEVPEEGDLVQVSLPGAVHLCVVVNVCVHVCKKNQRLASQLQIICISQQRSQSNFHCAPTCITL